MSRQTINTYPYISEVEPNPRGKGIRQWAICWHGKLIQRSDHDHPSEAKAQLQGMKQIEWLLSGLDEGRF